MKSISIFIILFFVSFSLQAQKQGQARLDSLLAELPSQPDDTNKVKTLSRIGIEYYQIDPPKGIDYGNQVYELSNRLNYQAGLGNAYSILSCCYAAQSNFPVAVDYALKFYDVVEHIKDEDGVVKALGMLGSYYSSQREFDTAISYYEKAISIAKTSGISPRASISNLSSIYQKKGDLTKALEYTQQDIELCRKENNKMAEANAIGNLGGVYVKRGEFSKGIDLLFQSLTRSRELGNTTYIAYSYRYLGSVYVAICRDSNATALNEIMKGNKALALKLAQSYNDSALAMAIKMGSVSNQSDCYRAMSENQKLLGNFKLSLEYYEKFTQLKDSVFNKEKSNKITQLTMQYDFDKKEAAEKARHEKEVAMAHAEVQKQRIMRNGSIAGTFGILLFMGISFFNYKRQRQLEKMQALSTERLRISRELHDDVGSALGSIALYSDVAITRSLKKESNNDVLMKIGNASRELVERMSDIIWSMNPDNENSEKLITRMKGFGSSLLTPLKINVQYDFDPSLIKLPLSGDQMKNIFLIYKETVYNIAKYAESRNVEISLKENGNNLLFNIRDDGKGFDQSVTKDAYNGNGLNNMKARTVLLQGNLNIISKPGEGTHIQLLVPIVR